MPKARNSEGVLKPPSLSFLLFMDALHAYSNREKRVCGAHLILTLCKFGRWLSWALLPGIRPFRFLMESSGGMSLELKAQISLRPNSVLPLMVGVAAIPVLAVTLLMGKGA